MTYGTTQLERSIRRLFRPIPLLLGVLLWGAMPAFAATCSVLDRTTKALPKLTSEDLFAVAGDAGGFYAVGDHGAALFSANGVDWQNSDPITDLRLAAVAVGNGAAVAVGDQGAAIFSAGGGSWQQSPVGLKTNLVGAAFGNGVFVVVGAGGNAASSLDGQSWTKQPTGTTNHFVKVTFGSGVFVAATTASEVLVSADGARWSRYRVASPLIHLRPVSGGFLGLSADGRVASSIDGRVWSLIAPHSLTQVSDVGSDGRDLYAVGAGGSLYRSKNSLDWAPLTVPVEVAGRDLEGLAFNGAQGVAVGRQGLLLSFTGTGPITSVNRDKFEDLLSVTYGDGWFVAVGKGGRILAAQGATNTWEAPDVPTTNDLSATAYGLGRFIALGGVSTNVAGILHATVLMSTNATNWTVVFQQPALTNQESGALAWPTGLAFGNDRFVGVSPQGAALISTNGLDWNVEFNPALDGCSAIGYVGGKFIAVGTNLLTSIDGRRWDPATTPPLTQLTGVAGIGTNLVATGMKPVLIRTLNQLEWAEIPLKFTNGFGGIVYGGSQFVAAGGGGVTATSADGTNWLTHALKTKLFLRSVAYGEGYYVVVGDHGTIFYTSKVDALTGLPGPSAWVRTAGGIERDIAFGVSIDPACGYYLTGSFRQEADFSGQTVTGDENPAFFLTRYSDTGQATWSATGSGLATGTRVAGAAGAVIVAGDAPGGITFEGGEVLTSEGVGAFVASFGSGGSPNWLRQFPGTVADVITPRGSEIRVGGLFPQLISFGDELKLESTNVPLSFFLFKADMTGTNIWGRYIEAPAGFLDGLRLATDSKLATFAAGTASGALKFYEAQFVTPPDPGEGGGGEGGGGEGGGDPVEAGWTNILQGKLTVTNGPAVFLVKYDNTGKFLWATNTALRGAVLTGAAADGAGGVLLAGNVGSSFFVSRFHTNGGPVWQRDFDSQGSAQLTAFTSTTNGWALGAGFFQGTLVLGKTTLHTGGTACFVFRLDPDGNLVNAQAYGTADSLAGYSAPTGLAAEGTTEYMLAGYYDERVTFGPGELVTRGLSDTFLARLRTPPLTAPTLTFARSGDTIEFEFPPGYILQVAPQLEPAVWTSIPGQSPLRASANERAGYYRLIWP